MAAWKLIVFFVAGILALLLWAWSWGKDTKG